MAHRASVLASHVSPHSRRGIFACDGGGQSPGIGEMEVGDHLLQVKRFPHEQLNKFCVRTFEHFGVPTADARTAADVLSASDLRGIDSHGVGRLHAYFDMLVQGRINPRPEPFIVRETPATVTYDGDNGLGLVVGPKANELCMDKADKSGSCFVAVRNTNHYGIAGYYILEALKRDMIGWSMTNTVKLVHPLWGAERMLGTNPIAIGFPAKEEPPMVIDMATSAVPYGKMEIHWRKGQAIPEGWAIDADGNTTTNPQGAIRGGACSPLGSFREMGGHKGFCLGSMVDVLCGVLPGANWGPFCPAFARGQADPPRKVGKGIGHFFGAMRIDGFQEKDEFKGQMDDWIRTFRATKPSPGTKGVVIPGDPEREAEVIRRRDGIPVLPKLLEELVDISVKTGIPLE